MFDTNPLPDGWDDVPADATPPDLAEAVVNPWWMFATVREQLEWLVEQTPSAETAAMLERLRPFSMEATDRLLFAAACERAASASTAMSLRAMLDATTPDERWSDAEHLGDELALILRRTDRSMSAQLAFARRLDDALPVMFALLQTGAVSIGHARAIDDLTTLLTAEEARLVDEQVSERGATTTVSAFRRIVRRAVAKLDIDQNRRREKAKRTAGVRLYPEPDGMATLSVRMPATDGIATLDALNAAADRMKTPDDQRTHGQRQVQALLDALFGSANASTGDVATGDAPPAPRTRRRAEVSVLIDWASLLGLRNCPGERRGYGPVSPALVRAMLAEDGTTLRRLVYDNETGVLLDYGRTRYTPDAALRRVLESRDVTCRYPGCQTPAQWCDTEHRDPYDDGGATSCANCGLICREHHNRKTHEGFAYARPDPATGETVWTTP